MWGVVLCSQMSRSVGNVQARRDSSGQDWRCYSVVLAMDSGHSLTGLGVSSSLSEMNSGESHPGGMTFGASDSPARNH